MLSEVFCFDEYFQLGSRRKVRPVKNQLASPNASNLVREERLAQLRTGFRLVSRGTSVRIRFGSIFYSKVVVCGHCLVTLSLTINETLKWLSLLPSIVQESFWRWQCSDILYKLPLPPPPYLLALFSPSLISLMVSCLLTYLPQPHPSPGTDCTPPPFLFLTFTSGQLGHRRSDSQNAMAVVVT